MEPDWKAGGCPVGGGRTGGIWLGAAYAFLTNGMERCRCAKRHCQLTTQSREELAAGTNAGTSQKLDHK